MYIKEHIKSSDIKVIICFFVCHLQDVGCAHLGRVCPDGASQMPLGSSYRSGNKRLGRIGQDSGAPSKACPAPKEGMTNEGTNQEEMTPEAVLPGHIQRSKAFVGGTQDEALGELEEMFRETEDYEDEGSDKEEGLTTTASNNSDPLNGFCMVRAILCACGPGSYLVFTPLE